MPKSEKSVPRVRNAEAAAKLAVKERGYVVIGAIDPEVPLAPGDRLGKFGDDWLSFELVLVARTDRGDWDSQLILFGLKEINGKKNSKAEFWRCRIGRSRTVNRNSPDSE